MMRLLQDIYILFSFVLLHHTLSKSYFHHSSTMPVTIKTESHAAEIIHDHYISIKDLLELLESFCRNEHKNLQRASPIFLYFSIFITYLPFIQWLRSQRDRSLQQPLSFTHKARRRLVCNHSPAEFLHQPTRQRTTGKVCCLWRKKWARKVHLRKSLNSWFWTYGRNFNGWDWKWCCRFRVKRVVQNTLTTKIVIRCGLLSVTLLGERAYWDLILTRLDKLTIFGVETAQFATLFEPVISRFVQIFDTPDSLLSLWVFSPHPSTQCERAYSYFRQSPST